MVPCPRVQEHWSRKSELKLELPLPLAFHLIQLKIHVYHLTISDSAELIIQISARKMFPTGEKVGLPLNLKYDYHLLTLVSLWQ